jgi:hypothetical protein
MNVHERARRATQLHETLVAGLGMALVVMALSWLALRGDDVRAERMGVSLEELHEQERAEIRQQISEYRAENPNTSRCGHACIKRIKPVEGWE